MTYDTLIGLAGDWHGDFDWTRNALRTFGESGIKAVFQVGDFGLAWPGKWPDLINICESICKGYDMRLYVTPGNHENWEWIDALSFVKGECWVTPNVCVLQRNWRHNWVYAQDNDGNWLTRSILSLGGAPSIDFQHRRQGLDWFPTEQLKLADVETAAAQHADIMIAHDSPDGGTPSVQRIIDTPAETSGWSAAGLNYATEGRELMNIAVYGSGDDLPGVRPNVFVHGHFHVDDVSQDDTTLWVSLNQNRHVNNMGILDLRDLSFKFLPIDWRSRGIGTHSELG